MRGLHFLNRWPKRSLIKDHLLATQRKVLAQRMSHPIIGHQDTAQVGMPLEHNAEHIIHFTLGEVRRGVNLDHRRDAFVLRHAHFQEQSRKGAERIQVVYHFEARLAPAQLVNTHHIRKKTIAEFRVVAQKATHLRQVCFIDHHPGVAAKSIHLLYRLREPLPKAQHLRPLGHLLCAGLAHGLLLNLATRFPPVRRLQVRDAGQPH
jgi:hypothetical protein